MSPRLPDPLMPIMHHTDLGYTKVVLPDDFCGEIRVTNGYGIAHLGSRLELRSVRDGVRDGVSIDVFRVEPDN